MIARLPALSLLLLSLLFLPPGAALAQPEPAPAASSASDWAFRHSDLSPEPEYRFGRLANGMRYVVRGNANPAGTTIVRMEVAAGSLAERDDERGFAHFVEHMAFNGSTRIPEGEMVRLLERSGLAFGADTNASTSFETTIYKLDLPRSEPALLDTALMLMRETASELTFAPDAVERERGVMLAELRDRNTWALRNALDQAKFLHPSARWPERFPVGTAQSISAASAQALRAFWRREYVPARTTVIVIGDLDPAAGEQAIRAHFADWQAAPAEPLPSAGPVDVEGRNRAGIHIDPALSERVTVSGHGPWLEEPDTIAQRRENILRQIGYGIVNRRLARISRQADAPFRDAGFGTAPVFRAGRTTNLVVDTIDGKWRAGLMAAAAEYRRAMKFGFTPAEVAEQVANILAATRNAAAQAPTRSHAALEGAVFAMLRADIVPSSPKSSLERLEAFVPEITPGRVLDALRREAVPLGKKPLLRFQGRTAPEGGAKALGTAWRAAMRGRTSPPREGGPAAFGYEEFGPPGSVVEDTRAPHLGIRKVRFANGVRLNIKRTDLERGTVRLRLSLDGGDMLATRAKPLATQLVAMLPAGGLGKHSEDELQSLLAGRTVSAAIAAAPDTFVASARTTPDDLALQLRVHSAFIVDPGYRPEAERKYRLNINNYFNRIRSTPRSTLAAELGGILSDGDPRFTLGRIDDYRSLTFAGLRGDIADRLANGAIELGIVGDIDEDAVIAQVAATLGALPAREPDFSAYAAERQRAFTATRGMRVIRHEGPADQAMAHVVWPTRDDSDPADALRLELLERVVRLRLTDTLRERLGKAYSPSAQSAPSPDWPGYGTFSVTASVEAGEVDLAREAIRRAVADLRSAPVSEDELRRARQPMIEAQENALKSNAAWLALTSRAQTRPDWIERHRLAGGRIAALTAQDVQDMALAYLAPEAAVEILVLPTETAM